MGSLCAKWTRVRGEKLVPDAEALIREFDNPEFANDHNTALMAALDGAREAEKGVFAWAAIWSQCGFPVIEPSHRLAASLMCTSGPADDVCFPWQAFVIRIPPGLLPVIRGGDGAPENIDFATVIKWETGRFDIIGWPHKSGM